jgi:hypothetical protein
MSLAGSAIFLGHRGYHKFFIKSPNSIRPIPVFFPPMELGYSGFIENWSYMHLLKRNPPGHNFGCGRAGQDRENNADFWSVL